MQILLFVTLYLFTEITTEFTGWRERAGIRVNDFFELVAKSREIKGFNVMQRTEHRTPEIVLPVTGTVAKGVAGVRHLLNSTIFEFMMSSQRYVVRYLYAYCDMAIRMLKKSKIRDFSIHEIREMIGFPDEHEYCMHTAFYDSDDANTLDVGLLFESTFFLQTIGRDRELTFDDLVFQLKYFRQRFTSARHNLNIKRVKSFEISELDELTTRLNEFKRIITDFSNIFCTQWTPFVSHHFITKPAGLDDVRIESLFMQHVFRCEKCVITFQWNGHRISSWNCDGILKSQEYEEDVMAPFDMEQEEIYEDEMCEDLLPMSYLSLLSDEPEENTREVKYSLATLKLDLQWNSHYLNVVKYYNVASDVMLFASIKEGKKIFKLIKFVVASNCNIIGHEKSVDEMLGLRSTLSTFKAIFDKIVSIILDKKRINIARNPQKKTFDKQVNELITLLDVHVNQMTNLQMQRICEVIPNGLLNDVNYDVHLEVNQIRVEFEEYYRTEPILNISRLYHYIANEF